VKREAWEAVTSTITATQAPVRCIGNVKGRGNWFYELARRAEQSEDTDRYHYAKLTAWDAVDAGLFPASEVEEAKERLPDWKFRELYLAEPSDDGGNPFGQDAIDDCIQPLSQRRPVCWGWDLAKSQNYTVGIGLDDDGQVCAFRRFQAPWSETKRRILEAIDAPTWVDSTGAGDPIVEELQSRSGHVQAFRFTGRSKQQLMEGLSVAVQSQEIGYPDGPIVEELRTFEYEHRASGVRYRAPDGLHDDCVDALALAWHGYRQLQQRPTRRIEPGSLDVSLGV